MTDLRREADQLEALARRPLQPRREVLLDLAARLRRLADVQEDDEHDAPADEETAA